MKVSKSYSVNLDISQKLKDICEKTNINESTIVNNLITQYVMGYENVNNEEPTIIKCKCGCEYSSKISNCPVCVCKGV